MSAATHPRTPFVWASLPAQIGLGLVLVAAAAAVVVSLAPAAEVRDALGYRFEGIPDRAGEVGAILLNNLRLLAGVLAAAAVAQLARGAAGDDSARGAAGDDSALGALASGFARALVWVCDLAVAGSALGHALLIGAAAGAYGDRLLAFLLPHGPFELAAYSVALALYVDARRTTVPARRWIACAAFACAALVLGAPIEVYLAP
jgi:hypothetical protein